MNITILLALWYSDVHQREHSASRSKEELIGRLATDAYNSQFHSIRQIYRVGYDDEDTTRIGGLLPTITLQGERRITWPIGNAMLIVKISESSFRIVLENLLETVEDVEKLVLVIVAEYQQAKPFSTELIVEQLARMLFRRGVLNYCVISLTEGSAVSVSKYDVILNRLLVYDPGAPFETIFPPFLRSLEGHSLQVLFSDVFPLAYKISDRWEGNDVFLLSLAKQRFKCKIDRSTMRMNESSVLERFNMVQTLLEKGAVDIHIPRVYSSRKRTGISPANAYEWESLVLIVPKSDQLNLYNIMLQPFSTQLWTLVCCYLLVEQLLKLLSFVNRRCTILDADPSTHLWPQSLGTVFSVGVELVSFLLIEAYLAKITEFLLYLGFKQHPQTLDEFLHSDILVVIPKHLDEVVDSFGPFVSARLRAKMVRPFEFSQMPDTCCAQIDTLFRAEYRTRRYEYYDQVLGRKRFYILPGILKTVPMSYLLGRNFAFKHSFEHFILHAYESGLMAEYIKTQQEFIALMERHFVSKGWLTTIDFLPLFLLVGSGWCLGFVAFAFEILFDNLKQHMGRRNLTKE